MCGQDGKMARAPQENDGGKFNAQNPRKFQISILKPVAWWRGEGLGVQSRLQAGAPFRGQDQDGFPPGRPRAMKNKLTGVEMIVNYTLV
jgi:hypothetical protein